MRRKNVLVAYVLAVLMMVSNITVPIKVVASDEILGKQADVADIALLTTSPAAITLEEHITTQIVAPVAALDGYMLSWTLAETQLGYLHFWYFIYVDGERFEWERWGETAAHRLGAQHTPFDLRQLNLPTGSHQIQIRFYESSIGMSELSNTMNFTEYRTPLITPTIELSGARLFWDNVDTNATSISVSILDGSYVVAGQTISGNFSGSSVDLRHQGLDPGTFQVRVRVQTNRLDFLPSQYSNTITFVYDGVGLLDAPVISLDGYMLSWDWAFGADWYYIYADGERFGWRLDYFGETYIDLRWFGFSTGTSYRIQLRAVPWILEYASELSNAVYFEWFLSAPEISIDGYLLSGTLTGANWYDIYVNEERIPHWQLGSWNMPFDLREINIPVNSQIQLRAIEQWTDNFSRLSNAVTFEWYLQAPTISIDGYMLSWSLMEYAHWYDIYVNGERIPHGRRWDCCCNRPPFDLRNIGLLTGTFQIQMRVGWFDLESELSNTVTFTEYRAQLSAPTISIEGYRLTWSNVDANATQLRVYTDNSDWARANFSVEMPFFDLRFLHQIQAGVHQIQASAADWEGNFFASEFSNAITFVSDGSEPSQFPTPVISLAGNLLTWEAIEYANHFRIYVDGVERTGFSGDFTQFNLQWLDLPLGAQIQIRATRWGVARDSELSNAVIFVGLPRTPAPVISLDGHFLMGSMSTGNSLALYANNERVTTFGRWDNFEINLPEFIPRGTFQVQVRDLGRWGISEPSYLSNAVTFVNTAPSLSTPSISIDGSFLTWNVDASTPELRIYANGSWFTHTSPENPFFDMRFLAWSGDSFQIQVRAIDWRGNFSISELSNSVTFVRDGSQPPQLATPQITLDGHMLRVGFVAGAQRYDLFVNGERVRVFNFAPTATGHFNVNLLNYLDSGTFQIEVRAFGQHGIIANSDMSNAVTFTNNLSQLSTPTLSIDGSFLTWDSVPNATELRIYVNGNFWATSLEGSPFFDMRFLAWSGASFQIQAKATNWYGDFSRSGLSNAVTFVREGGEPPQFPPTNISIDGGLLSWDLIEGALSYRIYVNGQFFSNIFADRDMNRDLRWWLSHHFPYGTYQIQVRVNQHFGIARASELSNTAMLILAPSVATSMTLSVSPNRLALPGDFIAVNANILDQFGEWMWDDYGVEWTIDGLVDGENHDYWTWSTGINIRLSTVEENRIVTVTAVLVSNPSITASTTITVDMDIPILRIGSPSGEFSSGTVGQASFPITTRNILDGVYQAQFEWTWWGANEGVLVHLSSIGFSGSDTLTGVVSIHDGKATLYLSYDGLSNVPLSTSWQAQFDLSIYVPMHGWLSYGHFINIDNSARLTFGNQSGDLIAGVADSTYFPFTTNIPDGQHPIVSTWFSGVNQLPGVYLPEYVTVIDGSGVLTVTIDESAAHGAWNLSVSVDFGHEWTNAWGNTSFEIYFVCDCIHCLECTDCGEIARGMFVGGGAQWRLYDCGVVVVDSGLLSWTGGTGSWPISPWYAYFDLVTRIIFTGEIIAGTYLRGLFSDLPNLTAIEGLHHFDTSAAENMSLMFLGSESITCLDLSNWVHSGVKYINGMFHGASSLENLDISGWDTAGVINMGSIFMGANSLTSLDLSEWNTENATHMDSLFNGANSLTHLNLAGWNTSAVVAMDYMFFGTSSLTYLVLGESFYFNVDTFSGFPSDWHWQNVGTGTADSPQGEYAFTTAQFVEFYQTPGFADTWVRKTPVCQSCGEYPCICQIPTPSDAVLTVTTTFAEAGDEVTVQIRLDNNPGFAAMLMRLAFSEYLTLLDYEIGCPIFHAVVPVPPELYYGFDAPSGSGSFMGWSTRDSLITANGRLLTLRFAVSDTVQTGDFLPVSVAFENNITGYESPSDIDGNPIDISIVNGGVRVQPFIFGDANANDAITSADSTILARYLAGHNVIIDRRAMDLNGDGRVDGADLILFRRWLVGHGAPPVVS